jgi:hypothetical protein
MEERTTTQGATAMALEPSSKKPQKAAAKSSSEAEQIKMGSVTLPIPLKLLKLAKTYREDCGNKRADKAEVLALEAAQGAYASAIISAFAKDQDFQHEVLEFQAKEGGK